MYHAILHVYTYDPLAGTFRVNPEQRMENRLLKSNPPGTMYGGRWCLRLGGLYFRASDVAWFAVYGQWAERMTHVIDGNELNVEPSNLLVGSLRAANAFRKNRGDLVAAGIKPDEAMRERLAKAYGVLLKPAPRTRADMIAARGEWETEADRAQAQGLPRLPFIVWDTDYAHSPELDQLG